MDLLAQVKTILSFETSSQRGTKDFGGVLRRSFPQYDWRSTKEESGSALHYFNIRSEDASRPDEIDLFIYANVDTNNPSSLSVWKETDCDPLNITFKKDHVYGLGASHEKISIVPVLNALSKSSYNGNVLFVAGYGREMNMIGAKRTISEIIDKRSVGQTLVLHPTESKFLKSSVGRTKIEVFFPFTEEERRLKDDHDLRENIFSQSKIFNKKDDQSSKHQNLSEDVIFKALKSFSLLPAGTLLLDFSGGSGTITEAQSVYFEIDAAPTLERSMISRLENFASILNEVDKTLLDKFSPIKPSKALHIGKATTTTEGVFFYGFNLIPAGVSVNDLNSWFKKFSDEVEKQEGFVRIRDNKKPFDENVGVLKGGALQVTEATVFSRYFSDISIFGVGQEGRSQKPNERVSMSELREAEEKFTDFLSAQVNSGGD
jgi:hypothetical protein